MHAGKRNPPEASLTFARMRPAAFLIPQKCEVISMATAFAPDECTMATKALTSAAHRNCFEPSSSTINTSPPGTPILPATCLSVPEPSCLISLRSEAFASNAASRSSRSISSRGRKSPHPGAEDRTGRRRAPPLSHASWTMLNEMMHSRPTPHTSPSREAWRSLNAATAFGDRRIFMRPIEACAG